MIRCEGICMVTVRSDTRTIDWNGTKMNVSPGPRTPSNLPRKNTTLSSYCGRTRNQARKSRTIAMAMIVLVMAFPFGCRAGRKDVPLDGDFPYLLAEGQG